MCFRRCTYAADALARCPGVGRYCPNRLTWLANIPPISASTSCRINPPRALGRVTPAKLLALVRTLIICGLMISTRSKCEGIAINPECKHFGYVIHDVARLLKRHFDAESQRHDLTLPQWRVIAQLSHADGVSQVALAGLIETDPMTVSGVVERLATKGLVIRVADPDDSRAKIVKITDKARAMVSEMKH